MDPREDGGNRAVARQDERGPTSRVAPSLALPANPAMLAVVDATWCSVLLGTAGLWIAAAVALTLTFTHRPRSDSHAWRSRLARQVLLCTAIQGLHFLEEWRTGFHRLWPERLGLTPWSEAFFVSFNLVWIAIWLISAASLWSGRRWAFFPAWFLALAALLNGVGHPLLAASVGGYFPGLWTSPLLGIAGAFLFHALRAND